MEKLLDYYKSNLKALIFIGGVASFLFISVTPQLVAWATPGLAQALPWVNSSEAATNVINFSITIVLTLLLLFGEMLIRKSLWKLPMFYPQLDFAGEWLGSTFYTHLELESPQITKTNFKPRYEHHRVVVEQDATHIVITPAGGNEGSIAQWKSLAITLTNDAILKYAYHVHYRFREDHFLPEESMGYEEMEASSVKKADGKPILLTGKFYQCAIGHTPLYRGETVFIRKGYAHLLNKHDLPEHAHGLLTLADK
jgi:hypothetical protein